LEEKSEREKKGEKGKRKGEVGRKGEGEKGGKTSNNLFLSASSDYLLKPSPFFPS